MKKYMIWIVVQEVKKDSKGKYRDFEDIWATTYDNKYYKTAKKAKQIALEIR